MLRQMILKQSFSYHKCLAWVGAVALLCFTLSAITHPLMSWTGPQAKAFFPPKMKEINDAYVEAVPAILVRHGLTEALTVKVVPSEKGAVLQVTTEDKAPRRYFDLQTHQEIKEYDKEHAIWLARYYTGFKDTPITSITFQTEFDAAYPWVNRLLPVYRIHFATEDDRIVFIYTEINALASMTNNWKTGLQSIFRALHTWGWLDDVENARVFLMLLGLLAAFGLTVTGIAMIFLMKSRKIRDPKRRFHRWIAYIVWLPLCFFTISGVYHLLQYAYTDTHRGLQLGNPIPLSPEALSRSGAWLDAYKSQSLHALSLTHGLEGQLLYRLGVSNQKKDNQQVSREARYRGMAIEKPAIYVDATTGKPSPITDKEIAQYHARKHLGLSEAAITYTKHVTHFGPHYDFRNKRLPVWRIDFDSPKGDKLFIDPATGIIVDRLVDVERYEAYSFSFLHKWNFLTPFIGRKARDVVIVLILASTLALSVFGILMLLKSKRLQQK